MLLAEAQTETLVGIVKSEPVPLPIAIRVYPLLERTEPKNRTDKIWRAPRAMLVVDTETRTDSTQRLTFGSYRFFVDGELREEGLFCADDLSKRERKTLEQYVNRWNKRASKTSEISLLLLTRREFLKKFYKAVYKSRALLVGFNLPFDLSRLAIAARPARGRFAGGFSLALWSYTKEGVEKPSTRRPGIGIKHIDSKRALKGFTARFGPDDSDLIPEDSTTGQPRKGYKFRGHMLDLRTLVFALIDRSCSLETACKVFGVEHGKQHVSRHGVITNKYIDYNRRDVQATSELAVKLLAEYVKHPISLQPTKAYSPASIGKAYLGAMRVLPILERQPDFPMKYVGFAQTAFFGGRTSAHIRNVPVPVVFVDFLSMYPTVNGLMDLWKFVTAREIRVASGCQEEMERFLRGLRPDKLLDQRTWKKLPAFVKVIPNGDILPSRSKYSSASNDWQVAVNYLYASDHPESEGLWFSLPDVAASVLLTGKVPKIIDAFKLVPEGKHSNLRTVLLGGEVPVDPRTQDLFRTIIEQRKLFSKKKNGPREEMDRLDKALKVFANASSYGIYAEMNRQETEKRVKLKCQGIDPEPYACSVIHPEKPGEFCFPPLASLITGAARLMLALLELCVAELGGTYAMEDTDSMAIVATKHGGFIPCPGGNLVKNSVEGVNALTWKQVDQTVKKFEALNPYNRQIISGSILKIEDDNFDPKTGKQRQIHCLAISAKRYALFTLSRNGEPELLREGKNNKKDHWSRHGLGHLLNPTDPEASDRNWTAAVWDSIVRKALGFKVKKLPFAHLPAIGRTTVSSPFLMKSLESLNAEKPYADQIKPFNFLLTSHVSAFGHPLGVDPEKFHLISPYDSDSCKWLEKEWIDQHSGKRYRITTKGDYGTRYAARVKTYGDVITDYESHPEAKCADSGGNPCDRQTVGLLRRRHIKVDQIKCIAKESNSLEKAEEGTVHSEQNVYTEYSDPKLSEWITKLQPALKKPPLVVLVKECEDRLSRRELIELRAGRSKPHRKNQELLAAILKNLCLL
ncbi:MAG TPA: hypothetical protein VKP61_06250 [Candidatus Acidoferrum sp.]|nr:hypothetical protein [Candidatus Acidoferrum sp.]